MRRSSDTSGKQRTGSGVCENCLAQAVPGGRFCSACYGGVFHPEGKPMLPGDPDDPYREFNFEADVYLWDQKMPEFVFLAIEHAKAQRWKKKREE